MLRQTIAPLPKLLYDYMIHLAVTQSGRWLEQKRTTSERPESGCKPVFMISIREHPVLWNLFFRITIHVLSCHITQTEIHFSVPRPRKIQSALRNPFSNRSATEVHSGSDFLCWYPVTFCKFSGEPPCQMPTHYILITPPRRRSIYFESFVSWLQFKGKKIRFLTHINTMTFMFLFLKYITPWEDSFCSFFFFFFLMHVTTQ